MAPYISHPQVDDLELVEPKISEIVMDCIY
jgi:hypothetical protein